MQKLNFSLLLLLFPVTLFSQISINDNDMPSTGDTIRTSNSFDVGLLDYVSTGAGYSWDFSELIPLTQQVDTFMSISETPLVYQAVFFFSSNLAQPIQNFETVPGYEVSEAYNFYKNSSSSFKMTGNAASLNGIPIPNKFDEDDIIYKFPMNYGNVDSSLSSYGMDVPGLGYMGGWKKRVNHCDGWGTLTTPYGSFQTLRLRSDIVQYDSVYIDSLGFGLPFYRNYVEYKWLGNNFGIPLCTVTDNGISPSITYIDSVRTLFVGIEPEQEVDNTVKLFPNPSGNDAFSINLYLEKTSHAVITMRNSRGGIVKNLYDGTILQGGFVGKFDLSGESLSKGLYFVIIETDNKVYAEKLVLQ
ncbi:MAG: T9SS type A sorting domain-containing protein [Chlorobi bacterium]|nr:T9SS type A sorting domain-containing protein [Chlorobiota bacterium]